MAEAEEELSSLARVHARPGLKPRQPGTRAQVFYPLVGCLWAGEDLIVLWLVECEVLLASHAPASPRTEPKVSKNVENNSLKRLHALFLLNLSCAQSFLRIKLFL